MRKLGQMKRMRIREKPLLWPPFLHGQISHQPNNVITQLITVPLTQSSTKAIPKSATRPSCLPHTHCPNTTFSTNQNTNQERNFGRGYGYHCIIEWIWEQVSIGHRNLGESYRFFFTTKLISWRVFWFVLKVVFSIGRWVLWFDLGMDCVYL